MADEIPHQHNNNGYISLGNNPLLDSVEGFRNAQHINIYYIKDNISLNQLCALQEAAQKMLDIYPDMGDNVSNNGPQLQSLDDLLNMDCSWYEAVSVVEKVKLELLVYPNPATNEVRFTTPVNGIYNISNLLGEIVQAGKLNEVSTLKLNNLTAGVYLLTLGDRHINLVVE